MLMNRRDNIGSKNNRGLGKTLARYLLGPALALSACDADIQIPPLECFADEQKELKREDCQPNAYFCIPECDIMLICNEDGKGHRQGTTSETEQYCGYKTQEQSSS